MIDEGSAYVHKRSMSQLIEDACRHWEARRRAEAQSEAKRLQPLPFTIALSREAGTQGTAIAHEVGRLLSWNVYDHELLEYIAKEMGLRTALLESVDERRQSWLLEVVETFASIPNKGEWGAFVSESKFVHHLVQTVLALGIHGHCVIVGRGAAFILPEATTFRVRLVGPIPARVAALSQTLKISKQDAAQQVRTLDRDRNDFVRDHFLKDPADPRNYDLVLNPLRLSIAGSARMIVDSLHDLQEVAQGVHAVEFHAVGAQ